MIGEACLICGCTDEYACPGGCWWVIPGVCSECVDEFVQVRLPALLELADAAVTLQERTRLSCSTQVIRGDRQRLFVRAAAYRILVREQEREARERRSAAPAAELEEGSEA
jgi:hypothetical protein